MNIGEAAAATGLSAKTIRYYEEIGLVRPMARAENGYRHYEDAEVEMLRFVQRARTLGFTVDECRALLALYRDRSRPSAEVKKLALAHLAEIDDRIAALQQMRSALVRLAEQCHGDERPDCPILDELAAP